MTSQKSTAIKIPATRAHRQFGELIRRAFSGKEHFIVEKDGLPVVAILSMNEYEELMAEREQREQRLQRFRQLARDMGQAYERQGLSEEDALSQLEAIREEIYQEQYGDEHGEQ